MRKCRKMISVIMLMVMLVSLLPSGAMAAEAPTGGTNEIAAAEEPQNDAEAEVNEETDDETDKPEATSTETSVSDAQEEEPAEGGTTVAAEDAEAGETNTEAAPEDEANAEAAPEGVTSTEIAAEVEPTEKTAAKDATNAGGGDLEAYVKGRNGSFSLTLYRKVNGEWRLMQKNDDGGYTITDKEADYKAVVGIVCNRGIADGTYTYTIDVDGLDIELYSDETVTAGSMDIGEEPNKRHFGTYSINGTTVTTDFENADNLQGIRISQYFLFDFSRVTSEEGQVLGVDITIPPDEELQPTVKKSGTIDKDAQVNTWTITIDTSNGSDATGREITDYLYITNDVDNYGNHEFDQTYGVVVTATNSKDTSQTKTWNAATDDSANFTWVNKTRFKYTIPKSWDGMEFGPYWNFKLVSKTNITETPLDAGRRLYYTNYISNVTAGKRVGGSTSWNIGVSGKKSVTVDDERTKASWVITATYSGVDADQVCKVIDGTVRRHSNGTAYVLASDLEPLPENFVVKLSYYEGDTKKEVTLGTTPTTESNGYYYEFKNKTHWDNPHGWEVIIHKEGVSKGSGLTAGDGKNAVVTITYDTKLTTEFIEYLFNGGYTNWENWCAPYIDSYWPGNATAQVSIPGWKKEVKPEASENTGHKATFKITFTPTESEEDLGELKTITLTDEMSRTLFLYQDTIKVTAANKAGNDMGEVSWTHDYANKVLKIYIHNPHRYVYTVTYDCKVATYVADSIPYSNKFYVNEHEDWAKDIYKEMTDFQVVAETYKATMLKVDESDKPLKGAVIGLFTEKGNKVKSETTGDDGKTTFITSVENDVIYDMNTPYYLQEIEAPNGYVLDNTKKWFVFTDSAETDTYKSNEYWESFFENEKGASEGDYQIVNADKKQAGDGTSVQTEFETEAFELVNKSDTTKLTVNKVWDDLNNADNTRPTSITVQLLADNVKQGDPVSITADKNGNYSYTWTGLKKNNANGTAIVYSVSEVQVEGYEKPVVADPVEVKDDKGNVIGYTVEVTNKLTPKTEVPVEKVWYDSKTQHDSVTVKLYANNADTGKTLELNETNGFKGKFTDLTKYDTSNKEIVYTIEEVTVPGYKSVITGSASEGFKITNTILTNIAVEKIWDDANDQDGKRPATLKVNVTKNGTTMTGEDYEATLNKSKGWKHTWSNLPAYDEDGKEITYSVTEALITGYTAGKPVKKSETTDDNGVTTVTYTITNTYSPDTVNAKVKKIWVDDKNADGLRTSIEVQLTKNGTGMGDAYKQTLNKDNDWEYEWTGLPANDAGVPITYSVMEITQVNGYTTSKPAAVYDEATKTWNISVTNTHDRILIDIPVEKVWRDDKTQHDSITVKLLKGGEDTGKTLELNEANGFKGKFTGLPKFENEGKEIEYTIEEVEVTGYTTAITGSAAEGYKITNTILTNIAVEKVWDDANDQDRKRPASITVYLTKNGIDMGDDYKATLTAKDDWKGYTWSNLPAYDEDGKKITYSVREDSVAEYTADEPVKKSETTDEKTGVKTVTYSIKNSYTPGTVHAKVVKNWDDNNDQDGLRTSIEVELTKNGTGMGDAYKQTLNEANNWTYEWSGLPEKTDGVQNTYSIVEISTVTGYEQTTKPETSYDEKTKTWNISVTNTHTPIKTVTSVTKVWDDGNDIEGLQPKEIKVQLLDATGDKEIPVRDEVTLNAENEWTYTWTELDKFKDKGTEIKYTVREVSVPEGYTDEVKVAKDLEGNFKITVTNKHEGRPVSISKTDITNGKEVEGATLQILLNNEVVTAKDEKGKDARAEWTSTKEPHKVYGLTPGVTYTLRETIQPEGFTIIEADTTFSVDENGNVTATGSKVKDNIILVEDAPTFVKVKKVDATSQEEVEGAHIQILDGDKVFDEWDSKKGVVHEVKYLVADKKYTLRETVAPLGYTVISDTEFSVNNKNEVTYKGETVSETIGGVPVILVEDTMTIVKISKTDITGEKELKGATLQILDDKGEVVTVKDRKGKDVKCEWESTDKPHVVEGLEINKTYTLREKVGPEGYKIVTDATFSIDEKNKVTYSGKKNASGVLLVQDEPIRLYVSKQAVTGDEELPGATLQILDEKENVVVLKDNDGNPVETLEWVSGEKPKYIEGLPIGVNYILRETISPDGYTIASDTKFSVDENGVVTSDGTTSTAEDGTTVLVVKDDFTTVQISKVDAQSEKELEGAKLQIIDEENNIVEEWTSTKEVHVVRGLVANKKYILREQVAPLGYTLTTDTTFSIDMHNVVTSTGPVNKDGVILVNDTMTEVEILKVDSKTGKGLAGAKLQVLDDNGKVCDEWTSTKDAHKIRGLYTGVKYTLHEVEAPKGYDKAKDITFTIDTAGKVSSDALDNGKIVMKDTPTPKKNKTGDEANGSLWALLLMMASGALGGTVWFKRKRRA